MHKILIAEDDPIAREIMTCLVESFGHIAIASPHGKHAYETLEANGDIDLLICDMLMPEMNGTELIKTLRAMTRYADLPIIIVSSIMGINDIASLLDLGATLFQPKPVAEELLANNILHCLAWKNFESNAADKGYPFSGRTMQTCDPCEE